jgi:hypothetical protein
MRTSILLILFILLLSFSFSADTLYNSGFNGIEVTGSGQKECRSVSVDYSQKESISKDGILSLRAEFIGKDNDNSYILTKINGNEQIIWPEAFSCDEACWARVYIPELKYTPTEIEICLITGGATQKASVFSDSTIGLYQSPIILIENSAPEKIFLGQRAELKTTIKNIGSKEANIFVQFVGEDIRAVIEISSFDIVEGEPKATTTIAPGEIKTFSYFIKPNLTSAYNLPSSVISFKNVFGENQKIFSNHPELRVVDPKQAEIILISEGLVDDIFNFKVKVTNNWPDEFLGKLEIVPSDLVEAPVIGIAVLPNGEGEFEFRTKKLSPGNYSISVTLLDGNDAFTTKSVSFEVNKTDFLFEIILAIVGGIIALAIFLIIYFWEN